MKRSTLPLLAIFLTLVLAACAGGASSTGSGNEGQVATIVAGTLAAMPATASAPVQSAKLEDFTNKELAGENDAYAVYLIDATGSDPMEKTGKMIVYDKSKGIVYEIVGTFKLSGAIIVSNDDQGAYVLLSTGTYTSRTAIVVSLTDKKQAVNDFCISSGEFGSHLFWNDYVIYNNCDTFSNRPWGAGEAPGVTAVNLKTGALTDIAKSDLTHQFIVKAIADNKLQYAATSVTNEADWQDPNSQSKTDTSYDLLSLGK